MHFSESEMRGQVSPLYLSADYFITNTFEEDPEDEDSSAKLCMNAMVRLPGGAATKEPTVKDPLLPA